MESLLERAVNFMEEGFLEHRDLFESLSNTQNPKVLFVSCADSRVDPNLITKSLPGDLFTIRNIANIVPAYRVSDEFLATTSAIEYALSVLNIKTIIVCGHSNCGGCKALYEDDSKFSSSPNFKSWIKIMQPIKNKVITFGTKDPAKRGWLTERLNVINSIQNLLTYPNVEDEYNAGELEIYGWHYIIETGEIFSYDLKKGSFELLSNK
ncbi:carbonic anhydrase [Campylobacter pinnipediorum subsp. pinnipediorum]|uniref:carbonic anhydrase n=1 Tax=Campylobacter pinnipediorum TaxID=1965231 RepID=UPI00099545C2|nr:carbonic anhydrase [Campylobacter pinnipediorum]OPA76003.1 carbonic anhydrase [Campylobacter pinnipediorum subsp. pinnipediorum]